MPKRRTGHPKSLNERNEYVQTIVAPSPEATASLKGLEFPASTIQPVGPREEEEAAELASEHGFRPRPREKFLGAWMREHGVELVISLILVAVGWLAMNLNREVGEMRRDVENLEAGLTRSEAGLAKDLEAVELRAKDAVEAVTKRIERLEDRDIHEPSRPSSK